MNKHKLRKRLKEIKQKL
ncbi:TPA: hypothetical protein KEV24_003982 [Escherichia coli]|nr:hypothetical protein [Escherichia coli]HBC5705826.1 hypothetical protein [Escherichia coli]HCL8302412.1 hypothetical protein [Escherichia coli]